MCEGWWLRRLTVSVYLPRHDAGEANRRGSRQINRVELNHAPSVTVSEVEHEGGLDRPACDVQAIMASAAPA